MANIKLSKLVKKTNSFSGKDGDNYDGIGWFPNKNMENANKVETKNKIKAAKIKETSKKFKSTFEEENKDGKLSNVPEKMIKHKMDDNTGQKKSNPKFINPDNVMKYIEETNMKISKEQITDIIRSEIKDAIQEFRIDEKERGKGGGPAQSTGLSVSQGLSKGGFAIQSRTGIAGDTEGGTRSNRAPSPAPGGSGGRGIKSSKGRAAVASAVSTAGASRLSDFQAAKTVGGRNATSGKISAGYIAGKSSAKSKFNAIVDAQITKVTTSRAGYSSGTRMYVALTNLINVLTARKTEYAAKWDYATAIYNNNSSAKTTARNAIISARQTQRAEKPVGVDPPPPPATPDIDGSGWRNQPANGFDRTGFRAVTDAYRNSSLLMNAMYADGKRNARGFASNTEARTFNVNGRGASTNYADMLKLAGAQTRGDTSANAMFGLIDARYGNRAGTAKSEAIKAGFDGSAGGFVWFVGRPA